MGEFQFEISYDFYLTVIMEYRTGKDDLQKIMGRLGRGIDLRVWLGFMRVMEKWMKKMNKWFNIIPSLPGFFVINSMRCALIFSGRPNQKFFSFFAQAKDEMWFLPRIFNNLKVLYLVLIG